MLHNFQSIRPFIGAKDYTLSCSFYRALGFSGTSIAHNMYLFQYGPVSFYLQDAYIEDWVNNTMLFIEVNDLPNYYDKLAALRLGEKYTGVRLLPVREFSWGHECYLHDPSGILWHFGEFRK